MKENKKINLDPATKQNVTQGLIMLFIALLIGVFVCLAMCKAIF